LKSEIINVLGTVNDVNELLEDYVVMPINSNGTLGNESRGKLLQLCNIAFLFSDLCMPPYAGTVCKNRQKPQNVM